MAGRDLGGAFDIHAGGEDLIFHFVAREDARDHLIALGVAPELVRITGILSSLAPASWGVISPEMGTSAGWGGKDLLLPMFVGWVDAGAVCIILAAAVTVLLAAHQVVASERWRS